MKTENWRRYAAWELVREAVVDLRRGGDITGVTSEKMKKLFPEIETGWEDTFPLPRRDEARIMKRFWICGQWVTLFLGSPFLMIGSFLMWCSQYCHDNAVRTTTTVTAAHEGSENG